MICQCCGWANETGSTGGGYCWTCSSSFKVCGSCGARTWCAGCGARDHACPYFIHVPATYSAVIK